MENLPDVYKPRRVRPRDYAIRYEPGAYGDSGLLDDLLELVPREWGTPGVPATTVHIVRCAERDELLYRWNWDAEQWERAK